jgi:NADH-quinone oxidoreductase subunit N
MTEAATYAPIYPEIVIALGAMALLMLGAFSRETDDNGQLGGWLAIIVLAVAAGMILAQPDEKVSLFNGAYVVDGFGRFLKLLILAGSAFSILMAHDYFRRYNAVKFELPILILLGTVGMMMMASAGDFITLYLGVELHSLVSYVLAAIRRDDARASEAGLKYFVLGALASCMVLYGASLLYGFTGSTNLAAIAAAIPPGAPVNVGVVVGLVFLLAGLAFKVAAAPFHMWSPDVYEGSPTPITAFFAAAGKIAAVAVLTRTIIAGFPNAVEQWQQIIVFVAIASMLLGAFAAIGQTNIKRLMAYSSIGHVGFILVGIAAATTDGISGILIYMAIYLAMTLGVFAVILAMRRADGMVEDIYELAGLAQSNLKMAAILAILLFSLAGVPPLAGFWAKWYVLLPAVQAGLYPLAIIGVLSSVVSAFYYLRIIKIMFFDEPKPAFEKNDPVLAAVMAASVVFTLIFVVWPGPAIERAADAAALTVKF